MDLQLNGKRALVAGASRGLGYATARALALEGCLVAINSRNPEKITNAARELSEESASNVIGLSGDVTSPGVPDDLVQRIIDTLGGLDILVTNSGGPPAGRFENFDDIA